MKSAKLQMISVEIFHEFNIKWDLQETKTSKPAKLCIIEWKIVISI